LPKRRLGWQSAAPGDEPAAGAGAASGRPPAPLHLLVLGGSQGAAALNDIVPRGLALIDSEQRPLVVHQAGEKHLAQLRENYEAAGVPAHCAAFIDDMAGAYEWADLVICRAGALTVAELAAAGVASVLVPFPHAVDDHQTLNANFLSQAGAATLLPQANDPGIHQRVCATTRAVGCRKWPKRARELAKPEATAELARMCEELAQ
jgi:UDP-N-acetylglucosamine--N-acetylmuramyl-(pentapeptide) pyrophosphoryl-undecaprenol N-acetylglucosamine transferase